MAQEKLTAEQFQKKYGGAKTDKRRVKVSKDMEKRTVNGIIFASVTEANHYQEALLMRESGLIAHVLPQITFRIPGGKWRSDLLLIPEGLRVVDSKGGYDTPESRRIRKIVEAFYGIEIEVWK